jgi:hypothetical protein
MMGTPDATRVEARPSDAGGVRDDIVHAPSLAPFKHIVLWLLQGGLLPPSTSTNADMHHAPTAKGADSVSSVTTAEAATWGRVTRRSG